MTMQALKLSGSK